MVVKAFQPPSKHMLSIRSLMKWWKSNTEVKLLIMSFAMVNFKMEGREEQRGEGRGGGSEGARELGREERRLTTTG